ncbi:MAG: FxsA family protein [Propionibacteriales bacterium]|nr:FxsA family protein [Propionibacteriales bacterium]
MWSLLGVALLLVPLLEIYVIIQVGQVIGAAWTIVLLIAESAFGAWIVMREGRGAWVALRDSFSTGGMPTRELADAALVLVGGTLLLTPGFVTDVVGFLVVLPFTRPVARRLLAWLVGRRMARIAERRVGGAPMSGGETRSPYGRSPGGASSWGGTGHQQGPVIPGEVVDDD